MKEWIYIKDVAAECMVDRVTVRRWIKGGQLPAIRLPSGHYRVRRVDYRAFLEKWNMPVDGSLTRSESKGGRGEHDEIPV